MALIPLTAFLGSGGVTAESRQRTMERLRPRPSLSDALRSGYERGVVEPGLSTLEAIAAARTTLKPGTLSIAPPKLFQQFPALLDPVARRATNAARVVPPLLENMPTPIPPGMGEEPFIPHVPPPGMPGPGQAARIIRIWHEQSETVQRPDGKWINIYGRKTPQAGQPLPLKFPYEREAYDTMEEADRAATRRSNDTPPEEGGPPPSREAEAEALLNLLRSLSY